MHTKSSRITNNEITSNNDPKDILRWKTDSIYSVNNWSILNCPSSDISNVSLTVLVLIHENPKNLSPFIPMIRITIPQ